MFNIIKVLNILFILLYITNPQHVKSDTYSINNNLYIGLNAGIFSPNDVDFSTSGSGIVNGVTYSASVAGTFKFDNGFQLGGLVGYRLNDFLAIETELAFVNFEYDKLDLTAAGTATVGGTTFTGSANTTYDVDGDISSFSFIFGPVLDLDVRENLEFFVGGGIGFSKYNDEVKSVGGSAGLSYEEDFTDFAAKFKSGFNYSFSRSSFLQFEYGYNFVDSGIENFSEDFSANSFNVRLVFNY